MQKINIIAKGRYKQESGSNSKDRFSLTDGRTVYHTFRNEIHRILSFVQIEVAIIIQANIADRVRPVVDRIAVRSHSGKG